MGFFDGLLGRKRSTLEHPVFGRLEHSKGDLWERDGFSFWGSDDIQLLITAAESGPTSDQTAAFQRLVNEKGELLPKCLALLDEKRKEHGAAPGAFRVSTLSIPSLKDEKAGKLWTVWFDLEGDDQFMYGVQTEDDWRTLNAFSDD